MSYCEFEDNCWGIDYKWCEGCKFYNECYCKHKMINNINNIIYGRCDIKYEKVE